MNREEIDQWMGKPVEVNFSIMCILTARGYIIGKAGEYYTYAFIYRNEYKEIDRHYIKHDWFNSIKETQVDFSFKEAIKAFVQTTPLECLANWTLFKTGQEANLSKYPHKCTICKFPAWLGGMNNCDCSNPSCKLFEPSNS